MLQSYYYLKDLNGVTGISNEDLKKWQGAGNDPFETEEKIEELVAPSSFTSKEIDAYIDHQIEKAAEIPNKNKRKATIHAWTQRKIERSIMNKDDSVNAKFFAEFVSFLLGKTSKGSVEYRIIRETCANPEYWQLLDNQTNDPEYMNSGWKVDRQPPIGRVDAYGDEIRTYIQTYLDRHHRMISKTINLKIDGPKSLAEHWLFFKYIVKGSIKDFGTRPIPELFLDSFDWFDDDNNYGPFSNRKDENLGFDGYGNWINRYTHTKNTPNANGTDTGARNFKILEDRDNPEHIEVDDQGRRIVRRPVLTQPEEDELNAELEETEDDTEETLLMKRRIQLLRTRLKKRVGLDSDINFEDFAMEQNPIHRQASDFINPAFNELIMDEVEEHYGDKLPHLRHAFTTPSSKKGRLKDERLESFFIKRDSIKLFGTDPFNLPEGPIVEFRKETIDELTGKILKEMSSDELEELKRRDDLIGEVFGHRKSRISTAKLHSLYETERHRLELLEERFEARGYADYIKSKGSLEKTLINIKQQKEKAQWIEEALGERVDKIKEQLAEEGEGLPEEEEPQNLVKDETFITSLDVYTATKQLYDELDTAMSYYDEKWEKQERAKLQMEKRGQIWHDFLEYRSYTVYNQMNDNLARGLYTNETAVKMMAVSPTDPGWMRDHKVVGLTEFETVKDFLHRLGPTKLTFEEAENMLAIEKKMLQFNAVLEQFAESNKGDLEMVSNFASKRKFGYVLDKEVEQLEKTIKRIAGDDIGYTLDFFKKNPEDRIVTQFIKRMEKQVKEEIDEQVKKATMDLDESLSGSIEPDKYDKLNIPSGIGNIGKATDTPFKATGFLADEVSNVRWLQSFQFSNTMNKVRAKDYEEATRIIDNLQAPYQRGSEEYKEIEAYYSRLNDLNDVWKEIQHLPYFLDDTAPDELLKQFQLDIDTACIIEEGAPEVLEGLFLDIDQVMTQEVLTKIQRMNDRRNLIINMPSADQLNEFMIRNKRYLYESIPEQFAGNTIIRERLDHLTQKCEVIERLMEPFTRQRQRLAGEPAEVGGILEKYDFQAGNDDWTGIEPKLTQFAFDTLKNVTRFLEMHLYEDDQDWVDIFGAIEDNRTEVLELLETIDKFDIVNGLDEMIRKFATLVRVVDNGSSTIQGARIRLMDEVHRKDTIKRAVARSVDYEKWAMDGAASVMYKSLNYALVAIDTELLTNERDLSIFIHEGGNENAVRDARALNMFILQQRQIVLDRIENLKLYVGVKVGAQARDLITAEIAAAIEMPAILSSMPQSGDTSIDTTVTDSGSSPPGSPRLLPSTSTSPPHAAKSPPSSTTTTTTTTTSSPIVTPKSPPSTSASPKSPHQAPTSPPSTTSPPSATPESPPSTTASPIKTPPKSPPNPNVIPGSLPRTPASTTTSPISSPYIPQPLPATGSTSTISSYVPETPQQTQTAEPRTPSSPRTNPIVSSQEVIAAASPMNLPNVRGDILLDEPGTEFSEDVVNEQLENLEKFKRTNLVAKHGAGKTADAVDFFVNEKTEMIQRSGQDPDEFKRLLINTDLNAMINELSYLGDINTESTVTGHNLSVSLLDELMSFESKYRTQLMPKDLDEHFSVLKSNMVKNIGTQICELVYIRNSLKGQTLDSDLPEHVNGFFTVAAYDQVNFKSWYSSKTARPMTMTYFQRSFLQQIPRVAIPGFEPTGRDLPVDIKMANMEKTVMSYINKWAFNRTLGDAEQTKKEYKCLETLVLSNECKSPFIAYCLYKISGEEFGKSEFLNKLTMVEIKKLHQRFGHFDPWFLSASRVSINKWMRKQFAIRQAQNIVPASEVPQVRTEPRRSARLARQSGILDIEELSRDEPDSPSAGVTVRQTRSQTRGRGRGRGRGTRVSDLDLS
jgi:hypothetical protein